MTIARTQLFRWVLCERNLWRGSRTNRSDLIVLPLRCLSTENIITIMVEYKSYRCLSLFYTLGKCLLQQFMNGLYPKIAGSKYTIPHRETVAGLATERSSTSNIIVWLSVIFIISPLLRHNFLLSSKTEFMFSIQTASTGPSKTYHRLSESSTEIPCRTIDDKIPSVLLLNIITKVNLLTIHYTLNRLRFNIRTTLN